MIEDLEYSEQDSLLNALLWMAHWHGHAVSSAQLTHGLPLIQGLLPPSQLATAGARAGLHVHLTHRHITSIPAALLPAIILLREGKAAVLQAIDESGQLQLFFPADAPEQRLLTLNEVEAQYTGVCVYLRPQFGFDWRAPKIITGYLGHWFWQAVWQVRWLYRDVLLLALVVNAMALALPLFTMNVYDRVVPNKAFETLWALAFGLLLVMFFDFMLRHLRAHVLELASQRIDINLSGKIMQQILGMRSEARAPSVGALAANVRSFESVREFLASASVLAVVDMPFLVLFLIVVAIIDWPLLLPPLVGILAVLVSARLHRVSLQRHAEILQNAGSQRNALLIEALSGIETLKVHTAEGKILQRLEAASALCTQGNGRLRLAASGNSQWLQIVQQLVTISVVIAGVYRIALGELTTGGLIACTMLSTRALTPLSQMSALAAQYEAAKAALASIEQLMQQPQERPAGQHFLSRPDLQGEVELREVSFHYPEQQTPALNQLSLSLRTGEHVAILGRMGAGKSTLGRLLVGLYAPQSGQILIDGIDIRQIDPADLRQHLVYCAQHEQLFFGSLRDNITLGLHMVSEAQILQAATLAGVSEFSDRHPQGLDWNIGERGEYLSAGQRQAVILARALLRQPRLLILDEPSCHLDALSEESLRARLAQFCQGRGLVLITHRSALLTLVDRVIVIDGGQIVADGPRDRVLESLRHGHVRGAA